MRARDGISPGLWPISTHCPGGIYADDPSQNGYVQSTRPEENTTGTVAAAGLNSYRNKRLVAAREVNRDQLLVHNSGELVQHLLLDALILEKRRKINQQGIAWA